MQQYFNCDTNRFTKLYESSDGYPVKCLLIVTSTVSLAVEILGNVFFNSFEVFGLLVGLSVYEVGVHFVDSLKNVESFEMVSLLNN